MRTPFSLVARLPRPARLALFGAATLILSYMALAPADAVPGSELIWDKAEHASAWTVLTLAGLVLSSRRRWAVVVFALAFGAVIEVLQATLPFGRDGNVADWLADVVGVAVGLALWLGARRMGWLR